MRSIFYGTLLTVFVAFAGTVQAANELDGKALLCVSSNSNSKHPIYGLVFEKGMVSGYVVDGYSKVVAYTTAYHLEGTKEVRWWVSGNRNTLYRETLKVNLDQCSLSSKVGIFQELDEIIVEAKKKNKI